MYNQINIIQATKSFFVTGITGNQGGAVARNLVARGFHVKGLTRDPDAPKANKLRQINIELIKGNFDDPASFERALKNLDGIFSVQSFENGTEKEISEGISLADLAKQYNVPHFIYSSVIGSDQHTAIPHWESKFIIENHIKAVGLSYTILRPSSFFENFLIPQVKSRILKGKLVTPTDKDKVQQFISAEDIGKFVGAIFSNPVLYLNKIMVLAAEEMNMQEVAAIFSEVLGKKITYSKLPGLITRIFMGKDLYKMFTWINKHDVIFLEDLNAFKKEHPELLDIRTWIKQNFTS